MTDCLPDPATVADGTDVAETLAVGRSADALDADRRRRQEIAADLAHTVLEAAARRLAEAMADYEAGLDRRVFMVELRVLDRVAAHARREYDLAHLRHAEAGCRHPDHVGAGVDR